MKSDTEKRMHTRKRTAAPRKAPGTSAAAGAGKERRRQSNTSGDATRALIITIAEKHFAERGIDGASINDITRAAGQRNKNATHYHFGDKQGLLQALLDKHEPGIAARQSQLLAELDASGTVTPRNVVRAMVQPLAEKLFDVENGGRNYLRFSAQLAVGHTLAALQIRESSLRIAVPPRLHTLLSAITGKIPSTIANQRGILAAVLVTQALAEWARMLDAGEPLSQLGSLDSFVSNLVDSVTALYTLPPSESTLESVRPKKSRRG